ncbi:MAG: hypothetical protein IKC83_03745 [Clostridia bacterium]|nr:hypothetical protein [Clostridia bacterium]
MAENGLINKMEISAQEAKRLRLPTTRKQQYWDILKSQFTNLFKVNLLTVLLAIPFLLVAFIVIPVLKEYVGTQFDFTGNIGIGYPGSVSNTVVAEATVLQTSLPLYLFLIPTIALLGIPVSGLMYVMRNLVWGENITVRIDFWKGIKLGWKQYLIAFSIIGVLVSGFLTSMSMYNLQQLVEAVDFFGVVALVLSIIGMVLLASITIYILPMMAMYKMSFYKLVKNSVILSIAMFPYTFLMLLLTAAPFLLAEMLGQMIGMFIYTFILFVGVSMLTLMWTVYVQFVLDTTVNAKAKNAAYKRGIYVVKEEEEEESEDGTKEKKPVQHRYMNPKKKRKTTTVQPTLRENFSRSDIQKMMEEKEKFYDEIDKEEKEDKESE